MRALIREHRDAVLALAFGISVQAELWLSEARVDDRRVLAPLGLVVCGALLFRRSAPLPALAVAVGTSIGINVLQTPGTEDPIVAVVAMLVLVYSVGAHVHGRAAWLGAALVLVAIVTAFLQDPEGATFGSFLFFALAVGGPWLAGRAMAQRRDRERILVAERDERARAAVAEERLRIARELHDVVAHAFGVVVLQARGARRVLDTDPGTARGALDEIEETGRDALAEMRRLLGLLRADDEALGLGPAPSLAQLDALAGSVRDAGLPVEIEIQGGPRELPRGVDLAAYRIVQEALTNALRHAGPAKARIVVRYGDEAVELEVLDDGRGGAKANGGGHGLIGMRERAAVLGGLVEAGPRPEGGFAVRARLPL